MKALKLIVIGMVLFLSGAVQAQVSVNVTIGSPPPWGPVGYTEVRYYYLPDVEAYYDVQSSMFIYYGGGAWIRRANLPGRYRNYDLYSGYKVVMTDYHGDTPYTHFKEHKTKYARGYHGPEQKTFGERPGKGNSGEKKSNEGNHNYKGDKHDNKGGGHGHESTGHHGGGKGKKK
ncbi:MAG: hypothetical protein M0Q51_02425 [Bacteroidales bacterium]|nr:hypothetical protein [Bacteroidales bacterium]